MSLLQTFIVLRKRFWAKCDEVSKELKLQLMSASPGPTLTVTYGALLTADFMSC